MPNSTPAASLLAQTAQHWLDHDFYHRALVLGLDIGLEGIGIYLRRGPREIFARTFALQLPDARRWQAVAPNAAGVTVARTERHACTVSNSCSPNTGCRG